MAEWTTDAIKARIVGEARKQGVDPQLALAVATQESYLSPNAVGDNGKSLGLFQLQPAAAIDVGVNPQFRQDPDINIYGGVRYLKQKLTQAKGNVEQALRLYNGGGDPNYVQNVFRFFKPGVAEAAARPQAGTYSDTDVQNALKALQGAQEPQAPAGGTYTDEDVQNALKALGGTPAPQAPAQPSPPTARSTPEQDAAYRAWAAQQAPGGTPGPAPVSQTTPPPPMPPGASQGPVQPITDPAALLAGGGGPGGTPQPVTDPAALLAVGGRPVPTREQQILADARARQQRGETVAHPGALPPGVPTVEQETLPEGITAPSTLIPLAVGGVAGAVGRLAGTALATQAAPVLGGAARALPTLGEAAASYAGRWLNVQLGYEEPGAVGDVASAAVPIAGRVLGAAGRAVTRNLPGAGVVRHELGEEALEGLGRRLAPRTDSDTILAQAAVLNPDIATAGLWRTTGNIIREEGRFGRHTRAPTSAGVAQEVLDLMRTRGGPLPMQDIERYRHRIGRMIETHDGQERENLQALYGALMSDLESAAARNVPGADLLRAGLQTRRLEHGLETLTDLWSPGTGIKLEEGNITRVYGQNILTQFQKRLHQDRLFAGSFTPEELVDIQGTLREVARMTARSPVAAPGGLLKHALSASLGTATGITSGPMAGLAVAAGVEAIPRMLAAGMRSAQGRAAIRRALAEGGGRITAEGLGMINQAIREAMGGEPTPAVPPAGPGPGR